MCSLPRSEIRLIRQTTGAELGSGEPTGERDKTSVYRSQRIHTMQQRPGTDMGNQEADIGTGGKMNERLEFVERTSSTLKAVH